MLNSATDTVTVARTAAPVAADRTAARRRPIEQEPVAPQVAEAKAAEATANSASSNAPVGNTPSEYRLVYDEEFSRTFIQIVDRSSGEEILRFPPEELLKFIDNSIGRNKNKGTAGLFLDRNV